MGGVRALVARRITGVVAAGGHRLVWVDQLGALGRIALGGQALERYSDEVGIADEPVAIGIGEAQGLGNQVERGGRAYSLGLEVEALEDIERFEQGDAARARRRRGDDREAAIASDQRPALDRPIGGEIG